MTASPTPPPSWDVIVPMLSSRSRKEWWRCTVLGDEVVVTPPPGPYVLDDAKLGEIRGALREAREYNHRRST